jgi:hypothetical protein
MDSIAALACGSDATVNWFSRIFFTLRLLVSQRRLKPQIHQESIAGRQRLKTLSASARSHSGDGIHRGLAEALAHEEESA